VAPLEVREGGERLRGEDKRGASAARVAATCNEKAAGGRAKVAARSSSVDVTSCRSCKGKKDTHERESNTGETRGRGLHTSWKSCGYQEMKKEGRGQSRMTPQSLSRIPVCHPRNDGHKYCGLLILLVMQSAARQLGVALLPEEGTRSQEELHCYHHDACLLISIT
jgi:hypothetical protein